MDLFENGHFCYVGSRVFMFNRNTVISYVFRFLKLLIIKRKYAILAVTHDDVHVAWRERGKLIN